MQPHTAQESATTPAPVLLSGFLLVGLAVVFLGYRMVSLRADSGSEEKPVAMEVELGEFTETRSLAFEERLLNTQARKRHASAIGQAWSSQAHPARPVASGPVALASLNDVPPAGAERQADDLSADEQPPLRLAELVPSAALARGVIRASADPVPLEGTWNSSSHSLPAAAAPAPRSGPELPELSGQEKPRIAIAESPNIEPDLPSGMPEIEISLGVSAGASLVEPSLPEPAATPAAREPEPVVSPAPTRPNGNSQKSKIWTQGIVRGDVSRRHVLLSFDGGSSASSAAAILDTLRQENIRTTLFLTGSFIRNFPALVHQALADGHEVGNHTDSHLHLTTWAENRRHRTRAGISRRVFLAELERARQSFLEVTGQEMAPFWRAPYGEVNKEIRSWAASLGYAHVGWTQGLDSLDWVSDTASPQYRTPQEFLTVLDRKARTDTNGLNGAIVLMHLHSNRPPEQRFDRGLATTIRWLRTAGYQLVPASTLTGLYAPATPPSGGPSGS